MTNELSIGSYLHCGKCIDEYKQGGAETIGESPATFSRNSVGFTRYGLQVWCNRHNCNICHIDFEGMKHPADTTAAKAEVGQ